VAELDEGARLEIE